MSQLGQRVEEIDGRAASVAALAVTATFSQLAFSDRLGVRFPMLSDWGGSTSEAYGVRYDEWKGHAGVAKRSLFVIDRGGVIRYRWVTDDALVMPDLEEPMGLLARLSQT